MSRTLKVNFQRSNTIHGTFSNQLPLMLLREIRWSPVRLVDFIPYASYRATLCHCDLWVNVDGEAYAIHSCSNKRRVITPWITAGIYRSKRDGFRTWFKQIQQSWGVNKHESAHANLAQGWNSLLVKQQIFLWTRTRYQLLRMSGKSWGKKARLTITLGFDKILDTRWSLPDAVSF